MLTDVSTLLSKVSFYKRSCLSVGALCSVGTKRVDCTRIIDSVERLFHPDFRVQGSFPFLCPLTFPAFNPASVGWLDEKGSL